MKSYLKSLLVTLIFSILIPIFAIAQTNPAEFTGIWEGTRVKINLGGKPQGGAMASFSIFPTPEPWILMGYENPPYNEFEVFKGKIENSQLIGSIPNVKFKQTEQEPFLKLHVGEDGSLSGIYRSRLGAGDFSGLKKIANLPQPVTLSPKELKSFKLPDYKILPAEGEFASLSGVWTGKFLPGPFHKLIVEKIENDIAQCIYAWAIKGNAGNTRHEGKIKKEGGMYRLSLKSQRADTNYYFIKTFPDRLFVTWEDLEKGWIGVAVLQKEN